MDSLFQKIVITNSNTLISNRQLR